MGACFRQAQEEQEQQEQELQEFLDWFEGRQIRERKEESNEHSKPNHRGKRVGEVFEHATHEASGNVINSGHIKTTSLSQQRLDAF